MQFKAFVIAALATLAAATPTRRTSSSGTVCCDGLTSASDPAAAAILESIDVDVSDTDALVGLTCTDVTIIGEATTCRSTQTEVTCQDNSHKELISISCVPVTLRRDTPPPSPGNVCCQQVGTVHVPGIGPILSSLGIVLQNVDILVGLTCTDVPVIGDSATCGSDTTEVFCQDNSHDPLISIDCVPVTL